MCYTPSKDEIEFLVRHGLTAAKIAKYLGMSRRKILRLIKEHDIDMDIMFERYIGATYGNLTIVKIGKSGESHYRRCTCRCICGDEVEINFYSFYGMKNSSCRKPECRFDKPRKNNFITKNILLSFWKRIQNTNNRRKIPKPFDLTPEYLEELWVKSNGICSLSGQEITLPMKGSDIDRSNYTASLDRIDSSKGYIEGNVQWVHKDVNNLKWDLDESMFFYFCEGVCNEFQSK